jgi:O-antigen ligase
MASTILIRPLRSARTGRGVVRGIVGLCSIAIFTLVTLVVLGASWELFTLLLACAVFFTSLCIARPFSRSAHASERASFLSATLVIWMFVMVSEAIFTHNQTAQSASKGHFDPSAYYQALSWILCFFTLAFISCFRPAYIWRLFAGPLKWASIFAIVAVFSSPLSKVPLYSLALAFKLCVIVLALCAIGEAIEDEGGVGKFFAALFAGTLLITTVEFLAPFFGSGPVFQNARLGLMIGLSGTSGILLLLSVFFLWIKKNPWFLVCALYSVGVMMLAGTKGGIVASFFSLMTFFFLLKKPVLAFVVSFGFTVILVLFVLFTPLGQALQKYSQSSNGSTLTGRTNLWTAVWPEIEEHPILGHGYRASRFVSEDVQGAFAEAGNMHNSFLEVLYNNGVVGLLPIVIMNFLIVGNLVRVIKRPPTLRVRYYAAGALALYIHLLLWGIVSVTFGGAPDDRFMTFFAVLVISMFLRGQVDKKYWNYVYGQPVS